MAKKRQNAVESDKQSRQLGCTWASSGKNRQNAFWTNGRACEVHFLLDFSIYLFLVPNGQGIPVFGRALNCIILKLKLEYRTNHSHAVHRLGRKKNNWVNFNAMFRTFIVSRVAINILIYIVHCMFYGWAPPKWKRK